MSVFNLDDARQAERRPVLDTALIRSGEISVCCAVRNLSTAGATLDVGPQADIPDQFTLIVIPTKKIHSCTLVWRKGRRIGVVFC
jgi:PilZ domain-containing protein